MKLSNDFVPKTPRQKAFMTAFSRATVRSHNPGLTKDQRAVFTNYLKRLQTAFNQGADGPPAVPGMP